MSFLNPMLLFGLAAVSVPIIIHLLNRRKFQRVVWAAMRFLQISVEQNQRRMRIEDLILLVLRCLLLALLALALARPALRSAAGDLFGQSKVTGVLILDNSYSMAMSDGTATRAEKAVKAAEQILETLPAGSAMSILFASDVVDAAIPEPTFDLNLARKVVREMPVTDRTTELAAALQKGIEILKGRLALRKEIYLVTDGQATGWKDLAQIVRAFEQVRAEIRLHLIFINEHETQNLAVTDLRVATGLTPVNQPIRFEARVSNFGSEDARAVRVALHIDSDPPANEFTIDLLRPGESKSISLFAKLRAEGYHSVTARLTEDRLAADDRRTIAIRAINEVRILLVDGEPGSEPRESETFFLRNALVPVPPSEAPNYFVKIARLTVPELSGARFDDYDAVVLANVPEFSETVAQALEQYVRRGGGLVIFPGGRINPAFYNSLLVEKLHLLPARFGSSRGKAEEEDKFLRFQESGFEHPIVSLWNDPGAGTLGSVRVFRSFELMPNTVTNLANPTNGPATDLALPQVVLRYADGSPAIVEQGWGQGQVILFSTTADTAWNDWPVRLSFVPLIHRTIGSIVQRADQSLNLEVGQKFVRRTPSDWLEKEALIFKPRQTDALRELRRVEMVNGWPTLQYERTDFGGVYEISLVDPQVKLLFAAQPDPQESSLDALSPEQKKLLDTIAHRVEWAPDVSLRAGVERERSGVEFWLPILFAVVAAAGLETFLAQWFSRSK